jgi:Sensors of blue-light using FAD
VNIAADLVHLSYCSQARTGLQAADLDKILEISKTNNHRDQITGLLTYSGDIFIQFVEGPKASIDHLMYRLRGDARHKDLIVLSEGVEHLRLLPDWDMELVTAQEAHGLLRDALRESDRYGTVIALSRLLAKLQPELYQDLDENDNSG